MPTIAVITTRNEAATIGALIAALRRTPAISAVLVADAASTDGTPLIAVSAGAEVIPVGRAPIGPALVTLWRVALERGADRVLQIDAGGSHDPGDAPRLLDVNADVVIGSRFVPGATYTGRPWRALLSRCAAVACNAAQGGAGWRDWTSGYRAFSRRALETLTPIPYRAQMHGWQIEVLARAGEAGLRIAESPIAYAAGRSAFNARVAMEGFLAWNDILHHIGWVGSRMREEQNQ